MQGRWLADTQSIAFMTGVTPATVRSWAHRGHLTRRGTGPRGTALYDVEEADALIDNRRHTLQRWEPSSTTAP